MNTALIVALLTATFAAEPAPDKTAGDQPPATKPDTTKLDAKTPDSTKPDAKKPDPNKPRTVRTPRTIRGVAGKPISLPEKYPTVGEPIVIMLTGMAATANVIEFTYQPDSRVVKKQTLTRSNEFTGANITRVTWTPIRAGIVTIKAINTESGKPTVLATKDVSVQFDGTPIGGLLIFIFAGLVLFGGVWFSMRLIFAKN